MWSNLGSSVEVGEPPASHPVQLVYEEAQDTFRRIRTDTALLVSIGTGTESLKAFGGNLKENLRGYGTTGKGLSEDS